MSSTGALPGFRDFYPIECAERDHIFRAWRAVAHRYGFVEYEGPPLESLELYTKKSGQEIVDQLYTFEDKGGRAVALRPEMTPTFARMVAARANALRKPLRWFSVPQLFRYERQQKGRLREHYQLNVDIVGEPGPIADAELIAVAIDVMRELGLTSKDVRVRVSHRQLLHAALAAIGLNDAQQAGSFTIIDKLARQPHDVTVKKFAELGVSGTLADRVLALVGARNLDAFVAVAGVAELNAAAAPLREALQCLDAFGLTAWIDFDPTIVRGLAYYTGIVFELFDAQGEFRAICGGGRYDDLLQSLGGVDLPALGFGMGDVVLGELVRARKLMPAFGADGAADVYVVGGPGAAGRPFGEALRLVRALREAGFSTDYALNAERYASQAPRNQLESAKKAGARAAVFFDEGGRVTAIALGGKLGDAPRWSADAGAILDGTASAGLREWLDTL